MTPEMLGQALSRRRKAVGLTQADLARLLGVTRQLVGELERGKPGIRLRVALEACHHLGLVVTLRDGFRPARTTQP